ncbi:hypothetical protein lerEdw1_000497 [Lerista edwardsae]|nr:hypothetical protein lerEdw1_000497 [Lerista edwardsae]
MCVFDLFQVQILSRMLPSSFLKNELTLFPDMIEDEKVHRLNPGKMQTTFCTKLLIDLVSYSKLHNLARE